MKVAIDFYGMQRALTRTRGVHMPIDGTTRVTDALEYVRSLFPDLPLTRDTVLATVNDEMAALDRVLQSGDTVAFLPPIAGG